MKRISTIAAMIILKFGISRPEDHITRQESHSLEVIGLINWDLEFLPHAKNFITALWLSAIMQNFCSALKML